jgi:hypothetical protein
MRKRSMSKRVRKIELTSELEDAMQRQFQAFREKFGRDPGPEDPVFFDPDSTTPAPIPIETLQSQIAAVMTRAGISPAFIYAYRRTGLIVTEENYLLLSPADRDAWDLAIEEYLQERGG